MRTHRGTERRQCHLGPPAGLRERRCGADRRTLHLTEESLAEVEARMAMLVPGANNSGEDDGSGWDKLIIRIE